MPYSREVTRRKYLVEPCIPGFAEFERWRGRAVLELGCGIGTDTIQFAKAGAYVSALDLSTKSLDIARSRSMSEQTVISFNKGNIEEARKLFGPVHALVYSFGVIHHTINPLRALEQARMLLADHGEARIMLYNRRSWKCAWIAARYWWRKPHMAFDELIQWYSEAQEACPVSKFYTEREVRDLFTMAGLRITSLEIDHIFKYWIRDYKDGKLTRTLFWRLCPRFAQRWIESRFGLYFLIKAVKA